MGDGGGERGAPGALITAATATAGWGGGGGRGWIAPLAFSLCHMFQIRDLQRDETTAHTSGKQKKHFFADDH